jgi:hypothetical protein
VTFEPEIVVANTHLMTGDCLCNQDGLFDCVWLIGERSVCMTIRQSLESTQPRTHLSDVAIDAWQHAPPHTPL